tara:strand:+ start:797 stop:1015 length:219 start_codon:yes stop_codon:yes gene_type:complete
MIKVIRHIQLNKISYTPTLFKAVITYEPYSNEFDESDEIEHNKQKKLLNKLIKEEWFKDTKYISPNSEGLWD